MNSAVQNPEVCVDVRACFSEYLDGAVSGHQMFAINAHLEECVACKEEFGSWREMQQGLAALRSPKVRPLVIQASAGFAGTIVLVGGIMLLLGMVAAPQAVMAHDIPLGAMTMPHYLYSAASQRPIVTGTDTTIVVEAAINAAGQVYDYKIVSGPESPEVEKQVAEQLMLSVFEPARVFDSPVRGRAIVTFAGISVRG
jgi:hypothetical protein